MALHRAWVAALLMLLNILGLNQAFGSSLDSDKLNDLKTCSAFLDSVEARPLIDSVEEKNRIDLWCLQIGFGIHTETVVPSIAPGVFDLRLSRRIVKDWLAGWSVDLGLDTRYSWLIRLVDYKGLNSDTGHVENPYGSRVELYGTTSLRISTFMRAGVGVGVFHTWVASYGDFSFSRPTTTAFALMFQATFLLGPFTLGYSFSNSVFPGQTIGGYSPSKQQHYIRYGAIFYIDG